jgi:hypothetical protein
LLGSEICRILPQLEDFIKDVVSDKSLGGLDTTQKLETRPNPHVLSGAKLTLPWLSPYEYGLDWLQKLVQISVDPHTPAMRDHEIMARWPLEAAHIPCALECLKQGLVVSTTPLNQRGVKIEELVVTPPTIGECESVTPSQCLQESTVLECPLVDWIAPPRVEHGWELVEIPTEQPLDSDGFVNLGPESGLELGNFIYPDDVGGTSTMENMSAYEMVGRDAPRARGRTVSFRDDVDCFTQCS